MDVFSILADPVRRRVLALLSEGERSAGELTDAIQAEFGISQPAVSSQLRVLRDAGLVAVRPSGPRRIYSLEVAPLRDLDTWLEPYRRHWLPRLDPFAADFARGKGQRGSSALAPRPMVPPTQASAH